MNAWLIPVRIPVLLFLITQITNGTRKEPKENGKSVKRISVRKARYDARTNQLKAEYDARTAAGWGKTGAERNFRNDADYWKKSAKKNY